MVKLGKFTKISINFVVNNKTMSYKVFLSPTKNINPTPKRYEIVSTPFFNEEAKYLVDQLKTKKTNELVELMHISNELANLTYERFQNWKINPENALSFHAITMYAGEAFKAFDFESIERNSYTP
ncbi:MAG: YaaA family protein, partial [Bacteroidetes bacterium]|nr:YaaA family protein [Bacteroidota bacterium]